MEPNVTFNISYEEESLKQNILKDKTRIEECEHFSSRNRELPVNSFKIHSLIGEA